MAPKLYYTPTSCGAASFIVAHALGLNIPCETVDLSTHKTASGADYYAINPKGNVPGLVLDDGTVLNEGAAVLQCLADHKPEGGMAPEPKSTGRYLVQQGLNWVASELHAASGPLFAPGLSAEVKEFCLNRLKAKYKTLNDLLLKDKQFLAGDKFTVADSYCYIVTTWTGYLGISLDEYPVVKAYQERCKALPFVASAHALMATSPATTNA